MFSKLAKFLAGPDGQADEMALMAVLGVLSFIGYAGYALVAKGQTFDPNAYGTGLGLAIGAAAAGMGVKAKLGG